MKDSISIMGLGLPTILEGKDLMGVGVSRNSNSLHLIGVSVKGNHLYRLQCHNGVSLTLAVKPGSKSDRILSTKASSGLYISHDDKVEIEGMNVNKFGFDISLVNGYTEKEDVTQ